MVVLVHEGWPTRCHFVNEHAKRPPVDRIVVALHVQDFRSEVFSCATETLCILILLQEFSQPEVCQFYIAIFFDEDVLRFEVSMNYFVCMQVSQSNQDLSCYELDLRFAKPPLYDKMIENVATSDVLKEEVYAVIILKYIVHRKDEGTLRLEQNIFLCFSINYLALLDEDVFVNSLHRILLVVFGVDHMKHLAKAALVNYFYYFKVLKLCLSIAQAYDALRLLGCVNNHLSLSCRYVLLFSLQFLLFLCYKTVFVFFFLFHDILLVDNNEVKELVYGCLNI